MLSTRDAGTHGRGQDQAADVCPLLRIRLGAFDRIHHDLQILLQLLVREAGFADGHMDVCRFLSLRNSTRPALSSLMTRGRSSGWDDGAGFGVGHQTARTEGCGRWGPTLRIIGGMAMAVSNSSQPSLRILPIIFIRADEISGRRPQRRLRQALVDESQDAHGFARAMRQHDGGAHLLVAVARVRCRAENALRSSSSNLALAFAAHDGAALSSQRIVSWRGQRFETASL